MLTGKPVCRSTFTDVTYSNLLHFSANPDSGTMFFNFKMSVAAFWHVPVRILDTDLFQLLFFGYGGVMMTKWLPLPFYSCWLIVRLFHQGSVHALVIKPIIASVHSWMEVSRLASFFPFLVPARVCLPPLRTSAKACRHAGPMRSPRGGRCVVLRGSHRCHGACVCVCVFRYPPLLWTRLVE